MPVGKPGQDLESAPSHHRRHRRHGARVALILPFTESLTGFVQSAFNPELLDFVPRH